MSLSEYRSEKSSLMETLTNMADEMTMAMANTATTMRRVETSRKLIVEKKMEVGLAGLLVSDD